MKRLVITEEEKNRILNLYEQSTSGNTNQSSTDETKKLGLTMIGKYKGQLENIVDMLIAIFPTDDIDAYRTWRGQYCGTNESKLPQFLKTKITPITGVLDDFFIQLKTDLGVDSVQKAIKILYNSFNTPTFQSVINFIGKAAKDQPIAIEIVNEIQSHLRTKYGEEGASFSSVLSGVLGKVGVTYYGICDFERGFYGNA